MYKKLKKVYRHVLRIPVNYSNRKLLKFKEFTIISSNCIGGIIYNELNCKFNSPTINLFFSAKDYIKFLQKIDYYLKCELVEDKSNLKNYPVGHIDDIQLNFVHYTSFYEARKKWDERKQRICWDKLYVLLVERDGCEYEDIVAFDKLPYKNKIVFVHTPMNEIKSAHYIKGTEDGNIVRDLTQYISTFSGKRYIDFFDYVKWINNN